MPGNIHLQQQAASSGSGSWLWSMNSFDLRRGGCDWSCCKAAATSVSSKSESNAAGGVEVAMQRGAQQTTYENLSVSVCVCLCLSVSVIDFKISNPTRNGVLLIEACAISVLRSVC